MDTGSFSSKKISTDAQTNASNVAKQTAANNSDANNNQVNNRQTPKKPEVKNASSKDANQSILSKEAKAGLEAMTSAQINSAQRTESIKKLVSLAIQNPKQSVSDSTFNGLVSAAKNYSKNGGKFDPAGTDKVNSQGDEDVELEGVSPKLTEALRRAFS